MRISWANNKVLLAPMAGITDTAFRQIALEYGAGFTYTEMVSSMGLGYGSRKTRELITPAPDEKSFGVQLFGADPQIIAESINSLKEGFQDRIAVFDINMGCPAPKIISGGGGCALMRDLPLASKIIEAAVRAAEIPVTVKFRKGWDEHSINAVEFARMAQDSGAAAVTVHGRTRQQFYSGKSDNTIISAVKSAVSVPVIGNGDITSAESAKRMLDETGCNAVMVARGALGNPFLFREINALLETGESIPAASPDEKAAALLRQAQLAVSYKGEHLAMLQMRKHFGWYLKGMKGAAKLRDAAVRIETMTQLETMAREFFESHR